MNNSGNNGRLGYRKPEGVRPQHQIRAYPEEWQIIKAFADFVKAGNLQQAKKIVDQFKK